MRVLETSVRRGLRHVAVALCLLAGGAGCTYGTSVGSTHDPLTPFPASATWVWDEAEIKLPDDERVQRLDLDGIIRNAVETEFAARNYVMTNSGSPQYLMSYEVHVNTWVSQTDATSVGTLSVELEEKKSGRRVWVGFVRTEVDVSLTREQRRELMGKELKKMLKNFPPSQPKS